jgi:hypothetical protein
MSESKNGAKSAEKIPALIIFGRMPGSNLNQAATFSKKMPKRPRKQHRMPACRP